MSLNSNETEIFNTITAFNLENAANDLSKSQNFSFAGLKELHDKTFTANQDLPPKVIAEMNNYYKERPAVPDWQKPRYGVAYPEYITFYSPKGKQDFANAEQAITAARPDKMQNLSLDAKIERLARVYAEIDYLHAFGDGNSRVNRAFVKQMAVASNVEIDFQKIGHTEMYAARDKSLAELNLQRRPKQLREIPYFRSDAEQGLKYALEDLNNQHPNTNLFSVFKKAASEIKVEQKREIEATKEATKSNERGSSYSPEQLKAIYKQMAQKMVAAGNSVSVTKQPEQAKVQQKTEGEGQQQKQNSPKPKL